MLLAQRVLHRLDVISLLPQHTGLQPSRTFHILTQVLSDRAGVHSYFKKSLQSLRHTVGTVLGRTAKGDVFVMTLERNMPKAIHVNVWNDFK